MAEREKKVVPDVPPRPVSRRRKGKEMDMFRETAQFTTNEEDFTLEQFYDEFSDKLPVFAMVTQGCLGLSNLTTFSMDQTMFCKAFVQQKRVIARDARERNISIPVDYPLKFKVVLSRNKVGEEQRLAEIIEEKKFPVQVQFSVSGDVVLSIDENKRRVKELTNLVLVDICYETFLVANGVYGKHLVPKPMIVPLYLEDLRLSTVSGVKGVSPQEWKPWLADLTDALGQVVLTPNMGDKDITVYSGPLHFEDHVYSYIKPCEVISLCDDNATDDEKWPQKKPKPRLPPRSSSQRERNDGRHLKHVTVSEFSEILRQLRLSKFVSKFAKQQVDGEIALEFTEDILREEFHMGSFDILKLMKYIHTGHIPK